MATFLANEINATDRDVTGPIEQVFERSTNIPSGLSAYKP